MYEISCEEGVGERCFKKEEDVQMLRGDGGLECSRPARSNRNRGTTM